jgi:hypothetical protein
MATTKMKPLERNDPYFKKIAKNIQQMETKVNGKTVPGMSYLIDNGKRPDINSFSDIFKYIYKMKGSVIQEMSNSSITFEKKLNKNTKGKVSITYRNCKNNNILREVYDKVNKKKKLIPHNICSIFLDLFNCQLLKIKFDLRKTYCILSINKDINIDEFFEKEFVRKPRMSFEDFTNYSKKIIEEIQGLSLEKQLKFLNIEEEIQEESENDYENDGNDENDDENDDENESLQDDEKTGLVFLIPKEIREFLKSQPESAILMYRFINYQNQSIIKETSPASIMLNNILEDKYGISMNRDYCYHNNISKDSFDKKNNEKKLVPYNINGLLKIIYNHGILNIRYDNELTYCILFIKPNLDLTNCFFKKKQDIESINTSKTPDNSKSFVDIDKLLNNDEDEDEDDEEF